MLVSSIILFSILTTVLEACIPTQNPEYYLPTTNDYLPTTTSTTSTTTTTTTTTTTAPPVCPPCNPQLVYVSTCPYGPNGCAVFNENIVNLTPIDTSSGMTMNAVFVCTSTFPTLYDATYKYPTGAVFTCQCVGASAGIWIFASVQRTQLYCSFPS